MTVATAIALLAGTTAACSSNSVRGAGTLATASQAASRPVSGAHSQVGARGGTVRGLVLLVDRPSGATIEGIDPDTGAVKGQRTFTVPVGVRANGIVQGRNEFGLALRSSFNRSLTLAAAEGPPEADGGSAAGVLDTHGHFTALTPPTKGYSSPKNYVAVGFDASGRLWYTTESGGAYAKSFASVDPAKGLTSTRPERVSPTVLAPPNGYPTGAVFWVGSLGPVDASAPIEDDYLPLPGGAAVGEDADERAPECPDGTTPLGWHVGRADAPIDQAPIRPVTDGCLQPAPVPVWPTGPDRFLTTQGPNAATEIYENQIIGGTVRATALLPQSDREVTGVVADPADTTAAFISTAGSTQTIYTVPLSGGQPHAVFSLPDDPQAEYTLFDWR